MNHHYLTGHVGVEHFAFDDKPELLPVPLAFLTPAEIATDGGALSGGGHLAKGGQSGQGTRWWAQFKQTKCQAKQLAECLHCFEI